MKKIISLLTVLVICLGMLVSCGNGASVPYYILAMDNYTENIFVVYGGIKETVTYYKDGNVDFEYSVYIDKGTAESKETYYYNVCESFEGYTFYGYGQELYVAAGGKTYSLIQADGRGYLEYVENYSERAHMLDQGEKYQKYSKNLSEGREVAYYVKVTPLMAAELYQFGITETDKIISKYVLMENTDFYLSIEYSVEHADGTTEKIAERKFEYFNTVEENAALFAALPASGERVKVTLVYDGGAEADFSVPAGVYIGIDDGEEDRTYYADAAFETPFDFENTQASEGMKIYAKNN